MSSSSADVAFFAYPSHLIFTTGFPVKVRYHHTKSLVFFLPLFVFLFLPVHQLFAEKSFSGGRRTSKSSVSEILDSLVHATYFKDEYFSPPPKKGTKGTFIPGFSSHFVPQYSDSVYAARIAALDRKTSFNLVYNQHVKGFIRVYAVDKRNATAKIIGLSKVYFPLFEEYLDKHDIPREMKYLAIVESALNPTAVSRAGARGLWQFMYGTGKMYGLESSSFIEDRYDPYKATLAASRHLKDLYNMYGDWFLALAAYNSGPGNVNKAIRRAGGVRDYWSIWDYLPAETRGYVPAFIAVNYIMNHYRDHNITPVQPGYLYQDIETLNISKMLSFEQINETIGVPMEELQFLNPQYKLGIIPGNSFSSNVLRLPRRYAGQFHRREQEIYAYRSKSVLEREQLLARVQSFEASMGKPATQVSSDGKIRKVHYVREGQDIGAIARFYRCEPSEIVRWNNLKSSTLVPGQQLVVFAVDDTPVRIVPFPSVQPAAPTRIPDISVPVEIQTRRPERKTENVRSHRVERGENLAAIARRYGTSIDALAELNGLKGSMQIVPGQRIWVDGSMPAERRSPKKAEPAKTAYHRVRKGDTLSSIANRYGVSVTELRDWNKIGNRKSIQPGQKLRIASR